MEPDLLAMGQSEKKIILKQFLAAILLFAGLIITLLIYRQGLSGTLHFDDATNLAWLGEVAQGNSATAYLLNGRSGLFGRPLSLASFVHEAYAWPDFTAVFIQTNIYLHLINGLLIGWLSFLLGRLLAHDKGQAAILAALSSILWMLLPILASSSLLIVQRMNLLSATFLLAGLIGYLHFRKQLDSRTRHALIGMSSSILIGGGLAVLAKENGALLPLYIMALELTLFTKPRIIDRHTWRIWYSLFLILPALIILGYLLIRYPYTDKILFSRNFNGNERILTQAHILWQYLQHAFLPNPGAFGPFQDGQAVHRNWMSLTSLFALGGWVFCVALAFRARKKIPLFAFAVTWFLFGHALESTTIPLELYFEHRNYLPIFGPIFALTAFVINITPAWRATAYSLLTLYIGLQALMLYSLTSLWGNPPLAAEMWYRYQPDSIRATQYLSQQLQADNYHLAARRVLQAYLDRHSDSQAVRIQVLHISCGIGDSSLNEHLVDELIEGLPTYHFQRGTFDALARLYENTLFTSCKGIDSETIYQLADLMAKNPAYQAYTLEQHNLHILMARIGIERRDLDLTMHHLERALASNHNMPTLLFTVKILTSAGLYSAAKELTSQAHIYRPTNPIKAAIWDRQIQQIMTELDELLAS